MRLACAALLAAVLGLAATSSRAADDLDPRIEKLVAAVSEERLAERLRTLAGFETRHTLSATDSEARGIGAARE